MATSTIQFITRTKLAELARQRDALLSQYDAIAQAAEGDTLESLRQLRDGLSKVRLANTPLHRDLPNIDVLIKNDSAPLSLVRFWQEQLKQHLDRGRLRANIVFLFGAFLSEWDSQRSESSAWSTERSARHRDILATLTAAPAPPRLQLLSEVLEDYSQHHAAIAEHTTKSELSLENGATYGAPLHQIAQNPHHPADVRAEARRFSEDPVLDKELRDALRVSTRDPRIWEWPSGGVINQVIWTRNKWRLYPSLSLIELCRLQATGEFWSASTGHYANIPSIINRRTRLRKLTDLGAPQVIMENEKRMLAMSLAMPLAKWYEPVDPWTPSVSVADADEGVVVARANAQSRLRESSEHGYGYGRDVNAMAQLVNAEIRTLRAAYPDRPLHVVKVDVRDYFAAVPHESLLTMAEGLGMTQDGLDFTQRFLQTPWLCEGQAVPARRGAPMEQKYSHWLCEWLMRLLEQFVYGRAMVRIIREIDDICVLAPTGDAAAAAYAAIREFLSDVGLDVNDEKCGAVTIGGQRHSSLPEATPRWGVLELTSDGNWQTHAKVFATYLEDARREVNARHPIMAKVTAYNEQLRFLATTLGLAMDLGDHHRQSVNKALHDFEQNFFGNSQSIHEGLRDSVKERYQVNHGEIPLSWMVWPITAGGLGIRSAIVIIGQYQLAYDQRVEARKPKPDPVRNDDWQRGDERWNVFYGDQQVELEPASCRESPIMKSLVESFIRRGKAISGGQQEGLSEYWRWILSVFGPEILDQLGTFEFLLTALVPLQLIEEKLTQVGTAEE